MQEYSPKAAEAVTLLTTKEVQDLFKVDRSTIYRMAEDGRIPAVKVGRQWRFPADQVHGLLGTSRPAPNGGSEPTTGVIEALPTDIAQAVADLAAGIFDVMAVVTDMQGRAISTVANKCGLFEAMEAAGFDTDRCAEGWRRLGDELELHPSFMRSHLGFLCARSFIRQGDRLVGMVIVGGVAPQQWPPSEDELAAIAAEAGVRPDHLLPHIDEVYEVDEGRQDWIVRNLPRLSSLLSQLATGQARVVAKLERIAALAGADRQINDKENP